MIDAESSGRPLRLDNIGFQFSGKAVLEGITLSFRKGVTTALIGTSGSGKSLVLKTTAGLLWPDEGKAYFEGRDISQMGEKEYRMMQSRTGFHFQDAALWANKSLKENLSLSLLAGDINLSDSELDERIAAAFGSVGLTLDPMLRPAAISMGQRKMVSFLRASIGEPEILFLDEPFSFLDAGGVRQLTRRLEAAKEAGTTIIMSTHNRVLGKALAEEVAVLADGQLAAFGDYDEIMESSDPVLEPVLRELV